MLFFIEIIDTGSETPIYQLFLVHSWQFIYVLLQSCSMVDKVVEHIKSLPKQSSGKEEIQAFLEVRLWNSMNYE